MYWWKRKRAVKPKENNYVQKILVWVTLEKEKIYIIWDEKRKKKTEIKEKNRIKKSLWAKEKTEKKIRKRRDKKYAEYEKGHLAKLHRIFKKDVDGQINDHILLSCNMPKLVYVDSKLVSKRSAVLCLLCACAL